MYWPPAGTRSRLLSRGRPTRCALHTLPSWLGAGKCRFYGGEQRCRLPLAGCGARCMIEPAPRARLDT